MVLHHVRNPYVERFSRGGEKRGELRLSTNNVNLLAERGRGNGRIARSGICRCVFYSICPPFAKWQYNRYAWDTRYARAAREKFYRRKKNTYYDLIC